MTATTTVAYLERSYMERANVEELRTPELVREFVAIKASNFPETAQESRTLAARLQHARLDKVVGELRNRYVLD